MTHLEHRICSCLQILARQIADEAARLEAVEAEQHVAARISAFTEGLAEIYEPFAMKASVWLTTEIRKARERLLH